MYDIFDRINNRLKETDGVAICVFEDVEFGGTYDRPWTLQEYWFLNDRGETIKHGR